MHPEKNSAIYRLGTWERLSLLVNVMYAWLLPQYNYILSFSSSASHWAGFKVVALCKNGPFSMSFFA